MQEGLFYSGQPPLPLDALFVRLWLKLGLYFGYALDRPRWKLEELLDRMALWDVSPSEVDVEDIWLCEDSVYRLLCVIAA